MVTDDMEWVEVLEVVQKEQIRHFRWRETEYVATYKDEILTSLYAWIIIP